MNSRIDFIQKKDKVCTYVSMVKELQELGTVESSDQSKM